MECAWEALEQAGCVTRSDAERVGIFAGASLNSYWMNLISNRDVSASVDAMQIMIGNEKDHLPTLVSYKLNLRGPSINVQTACSTSLVAVSLACQSLLNYQCDVALAGASSINIPAQKGYEYREGGVMSPDGHCRAFDAAARGTVGGDGVGVVALKRLSEAVACGDDIQAVIKGSAVNNDGALRAGYTAPGVEGQAEVVAEALSNAGVEPETIAYIEAHGTGTPLGDPIEVAALTKVYGPHLKGKRRCALGSVKTNIGHLNTAAGIAGLIKTVLALKHRAIPPSLHFERPNPKLDFDNSPFYVNTSLSTWRERDVPRRAGVSSFGIGGTNAHLILEEAPRRESPEHGRSAHLLTLSARTGTALEAMTANLAAYLKQHRHTNLADVAHTLQVGRNVFNHRRALVCSDVDEAVRALEGEGPTPALTDVNEQRDRAVVMLFPGQGAQYVNMARGLYEGEQTFRLHVDYCAERLRPLLKTDLREVLFPEERNAADAARLLNQTRITQPALFVVEYALAQLWMEWGVRPAAMLGHSIGEYVAACLAGVFSLEDALTLVAERGRLMQQLPAGAMLSVRLSEDELSPLLGSELSPAAVNSPTQCVASGPRESLERLAEELSAKGVVNSFLPTSHAFHSKMVEPILREFTEQVSKIELNPPRIPYLSNVTGGWITGHQTTNPHYWARQLRRGVRFADGVAELLKDEESVLLEVGPGRALSGMVRAFPEHDAGRRSFSSLRHAQEDVPDTKQLLGALGRLWLAGVKIDWKGFYGDERRLRMSLPTYPFERQRFWIEADAHSPEQQNTQAESGRKTDVAELFSVPVWKQSVQARPMAGRDLKVKERCLVFLDACGVGAGVTERLGDAGGRVIAVSAGEGFEQIAEGRFVINPRREEDFDALLGHLSNADCYPEVMLHLWGITPEKPSASINDKIESALDTCFNSLMFLARAHWKHGFDRRAKIVVVTNNAQKVTGDEAVEPLKAPAQGLCGTLAREYPQIDCRLVDIVVPSNGDALRSLTSRLVGECFLESDETLVAYRGAHRWTQVFEALRLEELRANASVLREGGVYLLTGAQDDFQLRLAEYLAQTVRARVVFLSDSPLQERPDVEGAASMFVNADATDDAELRSAFDKVRERFGRIDGLFHSAARPSAEMVQFKKFDSSKSALASAVKSAATLKEALSREPQAFMVLHSSTTSLTGAFGLADYCAAHAFHDALAHAQSHGDEMPVLSVDWGLAQWEDWRDSVAGMFPALRGELAERRAKYGLTFEEGIEALVRLLPTSLPQVLVSAQDVQAVFREHDAFTPDVPLQPNEERLAARRYNPRLSGEYVAPRNEAEYVLAGIWQEVFGLNQVSIHDNFFDLGGNSLFGIQLMARLRKTFQMDLPMNHLFTSPTVAGLAAVITQSRSGQGELDEVERMLREIESLSAEDVELKLANDYCAVNEEK
jgi:acyl transferase domain-containing protein/acyl carrier protein